MSDANHIRKTSIRLTLAALAILLLAGCAAHDRRSFGNIVDDQSIEIAAFDHFANSAEMGGARVKSVAYNGTLLLIGEVQDNAQRDAAGRIAAKIGGVKRVVNELAIGEDAGFWRRTRDSTITAKVKTGLLNLGIEGFDPTRVNVTTVRAEVYLMGLVSHEEAEAAVERISLMRGVRRVVKVFEYTD